MPGIVFSLSTLIFIDHKARSGIAFGIHSPLLSRPISNQQKIITSTQQPKALPGNLQFLIGGDDQNFYRGIGVLDFLTAFCPGLVFGRGFISMEKKSNSTFSKPLLTGWSKNMPIHPVDEAQ